MKLKHRCPLSLAVALLLAAPTTAQIQPRGHINNIDGVACTFTQTERREQYLHSVSGITRNLVFDDPNCMKTDGLSGDVNQMMIANFITRPYSHRDAAFQTRTREFYKSSALQVRGVCIQSRKYPIVAVVAEFQIDNDRIVGVKHSTAVQGCTN